MGDLIFRLKARRESALLDHDANLARLLFDCVEEIEKLECKIEKAHIALNILAEWGSGSIVNSGFDCPWGARIARETLKEIQIN